MGKKIFIGSGYMASETFLFEVVTNGGHNLVIANDKVHAVDIATLVGIIKQGQAFVTSIRLNELPASITKLLETQESGPLWFNEETDEWEWESPFYVSEFREHGLFESAAKAQEFADNNLDHEGFNIVRI